MKKIRDRGTKKWTSMMLPEHIRLLRDWNRDIAHTVPKEKEEWELEDMQQIINQAYSQRSVISLKLWNHNGWKEEEGVITRLDAAKGCLLLETATTVKTIPFQSIQQARIDGLYD